MGILVGRHGERSRSAALRVVDAVDIIEGRDDPSESSLFDGKLRGMRMP